MFKPIYTKMKTGNHSYLDVSFENDFNFTLSMFMNVDCINFGEKILGMLRDALNDKISCVEVGFDASYVIFDKNKTTIFNNIADDGDELIIDTYELYSLVCEWITKLYEFEYEFEKKTLSWLKDLKKILSCKKRIELAKNGKYLDILVNDKKISVRAAVAKQGYGLDKLLNDENDWVTFNVKIWLENHNLTLEEWKQQYPERCALGK